MIPTAQTVQFVGSCSHQREIQVILLAKSNTLRSHSTSQIIRGVELSDPGYGDFYF